MKLAVKKVKIKLGGQSFSIDNRIWSIFEAKAGDKKASLVTLANEYIKEGKSAERALANALDVFRLV